MPPKDSVKGTLLVALVLCLACSIFISAAAVILKPMQDANALLDRNKNILSAAGLFDPAIHTNADVETLFSQFTTRIVDLETGEFVEEERLDELGIDPVLYDQRTVTNDPAYSDALAGPEDIADIKRRVRYSTVYTVEDDNGELETIVLPVSGYGLWGIMYGFLALEGDGTTVKGIGFHDHGETPGLGGEITNPLWTQQWIGKQIYDEEGNVALSVVKGPGEGEYEIDGLSGATLTSRGVSNLIEFWLGERGFGPFLDNVTSS